jgi:asparagine synthetase B (glutamine-hydrolysing)
MCGIFFSLSRHGYASPDANTARLLRNRGPDHTGSHQINIPPKGDDAPELYATFLSTVLSLRGTTVVSQPLIDADTGSTLCWNGEAWSIRGDVLTDNDSNVVFECLLKVCANIASSLDTTKAVVELLSSIRGPYAIVFYDAVNRRIYYGRDCLGRRSLLRKSTSDGSLISSSVCDNATGEAWAEVEADGIYVIDLNAAPASHDLHITHIPHTRSGKPQISGLSFVGRSLTSKLLTDIGRHYHSRL